MRKRLLFFWEIVKIFIVAALIVIPIRYFIFQPFIIQQQSMEPNFFEGDYLIIDEISYRFRSPQRGEVIVFDAPIKSSQKYIKRIIGLPGETVKIKDGNVYILDGQGIFQLLDESAYLAEETTTQQTLEMNLEDNQYFVMGDNRSASSDSRKWGPVTEEAVVGRVFLRLWPPRAVAKIQVPLYSL